MATTGVSARRTSQTTSGPPRLRSHPRQPLIRPAQPDLPRGSSPGQTPQHQRGTRRDLQHADTDTPFSSRRSGLFTPCPRASVDKMGYLRAARGRRRKYHLWPASASRRRAGSGRLATREPDIAPDRGRKKTADQAPAPRNEGSDLTKRSSRSPRLASHPMPVDLASPPHRTPFGPPADHGSRCCLRGPGTTKATTEIN